MSTALLERPLQQATPLSPMESVMAFPMDDIVQRYAEDHGFSMEVAREHERELKRFLGLLVINPDARYRMRGPVDEFWHLFIIFTRDYQRFCEDIAGRFIHHQPTLPANRNNPANERQYHWFLCDYKEEFGEEAPEHLWPRTTAGKPCDYGCCE